MKSSKGSVVITAIIGVLVLIIIAGGVWYYVNQNKNQVADDQFKDWKMYTNERYGYEIKYPSDWYVDITHSNDDFYVRQVNNIPVGGETYFSNYPQASNYSPYSGPGIPAPEGSFVVSLNISKINPDINYDEFIPNYDNMTKEDININGIGAIKILVKDFSVKDSKFEFKNVFIKVNDKMFNFEYHGYPISQQMEGVAEKILSTFKFIEKDETANWKTYTSSTFGYSIKCPTTWTEKQGRVFEEGVSEDKKNMIIEFYDGDTLMLRIATVYKTKVGDPSLLSLASEVPAPKDKTTISGAVTYKIGNLDGYRRLVTVSDPASHGLEYITKDGKYIYYMRIFENTESTEIVNMLKTFIVK